jgi:predicted nucleotidyltransferase
MGIYNKKWSKFLLEGEFQMGALIPKDELNPKFWTNNELNREVLEKLREIALDIFKKRSFDAAIVDIIVTGSSASYNWHSLSDIDLHIILNFDDIDSNFVLVKRMLDLDRINWNKTHDIFINGHEVEIYYQDIEEIHQSLGVYSILDDKWIKEPIKEDVDIDLKSTEKKADAIIQDIEHAVDLFHQEEYKEAYKYTLKTKRKIKKMRTAGLTKDGVYSAENLAFKLLRNGDHLQKLSSLKISAYDKMMSLGPVPKKDENLMENWNNYINSED